MTEALTIPKDRRTQLSRLVAHKSIASKVRKLLGNEYSEAFALTFLANLERDPSLATCTDVSISRCLLFCAEHQLSPRGLAPEVYLIAREMKYKDPTRKGVVRVKRELHPMVSYRGYISQAKRFADVKNVWASEVFENEPFELRAGTGGIHVDHSPQPFAGREERGDFIGCYAVVEFRDGSKHHSFMSAEEIAQARALAAENSGAWNNWPSPMRLKCVLKRALSVALAGVRYPGNSYPIPDEDDQGFVEPHDMPNAPPEVLDVEGEAAEDEQAAKPKAADPLPPIPPRAIAEGEAPKAEEVVGSSPKAAPEPAPVEAPAPAEVAAPKATTSAKEAATAGKGAAGSDKLGALL